MARPGRIQRLTTLLGQLGEATATSLKAMKNVKNRIPESPSKTSSVARPVLAEPSKAKDSNEATSGDGHSEPGSKEFLAVAESDGIQANGTPKRVAPVFAGHALDAATIACKMYFLFVSDL